MATAIQLLRSLVPRVRPRAVDLSEGMPMVNLAPEEPGLYFRLADDTLTKIGPTYIGSVPPNDGAPASPELCIGEMWMDTSVLGKSTLRVWSGTQWVAIDAEDSGGSAKPSPNPPSPGDETIGDLWFNTLTEDLYVWDGSQWVKVSSSDAHGVAGSVQINDGSGDLTSDTDFYFLNDTLNSPAFSSTDSVPFVLPAALPAQHSLIFTDATGAMSCSSIASLPELPDPTP